MPSTSLRPAQPPVRLAALCAHLAHSSSTPSSRYLDLYTQSHTAIPRAILERTPPFLTQPELVTIMDIKLAFGVNRPALKGMISKLSDHAVIHASKQAFQHLIDIDVSPGTNRSAYKAALNDLCTLRGVGPATASLVLSLISPDVPFFSDEGAVAVLQPPGGRKGLKYTEVEYWRFFEEVDEKCRALGKNQQRRDWERQAWAEAVLGTTEGDAEGDERRKRGLEKPDEEGTVKKKTKEGEDKPDELPKLRRSGRRAG